MTKKRQQKQKEIIIFQAYNNVMPKADLLCSSLYMSVSLNIVLTS